MMLLVQSQAALAFYRRHTIYYSVRNHLPFLSLHAECRYITASDITWDGLTSRHIDSRNEDPDAVLLV